MTFEEVLDQAIAMLQRKGRVSYRALRFQFSLDDEYLEVLTDEIIKVQQLAVDQDGKMLVWTGEPGAASVSTPIPAPSTHEPPTPLAVNHERKPLSYTPQHLAEKILTSRSALEGERKQVTVLFADIKDSTELIKDLDPEAAQQLLDPAIHIMMEGVHRFEGTVNQVLGDGIMSLFGAPIAHEDHAMRACYAALAMQSAIRDYAEEVRRSQGITMRIRVGLNSGEVVVRAIGNDLHMDYSAVGQTTHLAARMEQLATPGSIVLTTATLRLVEGLVRVNALGPVPVKGMPEPVEVFELVGATGLRRRLQAAVARGLTKFVGRETEIALLTQALEQAYAGHGQVVAAVGEAGVGKSRLVYEFVHSHRTQGWLVLESASVSYGKATSYFPVVDLLKRYVHVEEDDEPRMIRAKVTGHILTLDETLQDAIAPLLSLLDVLPEDSPFRQLDPPPRRQRTLDALKRVLLRESQVQPLMLVFENLHWIDTETRAFLDRLVEGLPTARFLLLVNYRPEYQHGWGGKSYYTQLRLDPLPPASAEAFLQALLGNAPGLVPLKQLLIARTQGNPFFLEESVRTLVETKVLIGEPGAYRLTRELPTIQVPATVQAVLAARIDRLPAEEKHLLQVAAAIGTQIPFGLLQTIAAFPQDTLHRSLTHLQTTEFLYETQLFPTLEYTFKHALTQQVAYESLLQERRRGLHARIVDALETLANERLTEQVERLAYHAVRGEVWEKALLYCRQAGAKAYAQAANREAVASWEQALDILQHLPQHRDTLEQAIDLRFDLRHAWYQLGKTEQAFTHLCTAETLARDLDDRHRLGWASALLILSFRGRREYERALAVGRRALALGTSLGDLGLQTATNLHLGQLYYCLGDYRQAIGLLRRNVEALTGELCYARFGLAVLPAVFSRAWLVQCLAELGEFTEGISHGEKAIRIAEKGDHPYNLIGARNYLGILYVYKGDFPQAIALFERNLSLCQSANIHVAFPVSASRLGYAYALAGRVTEALSLLEQAGEQATDMRFNIARYDVVWLGEACLLAGNRDEALEHTLRALSLSRDHEERGHEAWAIRLLGEIAMCRDFSDIDKAEIHYHQALALANELGMRPLQAHCHRGLGKLYSQIGQAEQARAELSAAINMYRDREMMFWLPETEAALAEVEGKP